jgi:hypothetical protein
MKYIEQFFISALWGGLSSIIGVGSSNFIFDRFMSEGISNIIGLIISWIVDFFLQRHLFMGTRAKSHEKILIKFIIVACIDTFLSQVIFLLILHHQRKNNPVKWEKHKLIIRYLITIIISAVFTFPAEKYWVFKN